MAEPLDRVDFPLSVVEGRDSSLPRFAWQALTWERLALAGILLLSAFLDVFRLNQEGYANTYYAAAVKSMLQSWHNFFFVAFDPGGFLAVDKPPLGLWIQVASAKLLGFNGFSMLLPQALAGVLSVALLYYLVARAFGPPAGVLAALGLALTPIAVVDNRNNTADSLLVLALLLAVWAVTRAVESGRLRWLLLGAVLVGLGFNIKELQAYLVLPALLLVYLVGAPLRLRTRFWHLLLAGGALLVVSFCWIVAVDLTPASQRPYVTDSGTNSELSLALGYNGLGRLTSGLLSHLPALPFVHVKLDFSIVPAISIEIGNPGLFRLFRPEIGGQVSWLLPLALLGVAAFLFVGRRRWTRQRQMVLLLWGNWLLAAAAYFSVARFYHLYYLIMLAPPIAALAGIGLATLWQEYRESLARVHTPWWSGWLLPLVLLVTALIQARILTGFSSWNGWLAPCIIGATALVAAALVAGRLRLRFLLAPDLAFGVGTGAALALAAAGTLSLLVAPAAWAAVSIANGNGGAWLPQAGPSQGFGGGGFAGRPFTGVRFPVGRRPSGSSFTPGRPPSGGFPGGVTRGRLNGFPGRAFRGIGGAGGAITFAGNQVPKLDPKLLRYVQTHRGGARYLVATMTSSYASLFILDTGQPVMTLGGYQGWDRILTPAQLAHLVSTNAIRFVLLPASADSGGLRGVGGFRGRGGTFGLPAGIDTNLDTVNNDLVSWVRTHCAAVPSGSYQTASRTTVGSTRPVFGGPGQGGFGAGGAGALYDCAAGAHASSTTK